MRIGEASAGTPFPPPSLSAFLLFLLVSCCYCPQCTTSFLYLHPANPSSLKNHRPPLPGAWYSRTRSDSTFVLAVATDDAATTAAHHHHHHPVSPKEYFESLTVKELRLLVREQHPAPPGVLSTLKRKKDLVDFLTASSSDVAAGKDKVGPDNVVKAANEEEEEAATKEADRIDEEEDDFSPSQDLSNADGSVAVNGGAVAVAEAAERSPPRRTRTMPLKMAPKKEPRVSPKDALIQKIRETYPEAELERMSDDEPVVDIRQTHHPIMADRPRSDLDVVFLGTASCMPSTTRGVSCTALKLNWRRNAASTWLFDVGECTQLQVQRTTAVRASKVAKIFLTHSHGDHTFGLPGLLCLMGQDREQNASREIIDIYGPEGLRMWLRVTIRYSVSRIVPPYRVHEIKEIPMAPEWEFNSRLRRYFYRERGMPGRLKWTKKGLAGEDQLNWISQANGMNLEPSPMYGEVDGGTDIYPIYDHPQCVNGAPIWKIVADDDVDVYAAPMNHGIPCLGFVVQEQSRPGRLRQELVEPVVSRNFESLRDAGFSVPMKAMAVIKNLPPGASFTFPDGTIIKQEDAVESPRCGRKIVICGDTCDSSTLRELAMDADIVIHEATNAYLQGIDSRDSSFESVTRDTVVHGHSTPQIAGAFSRSVRAKSLLLNHFSSRYKGDTSIASLSIMMRIEDGARVSSGLEESEIAAAWDLMVLSVPASKS